jgi:glycerol uptake facilitator-like aquaporin
MTESLSRRVVAEAVGSALLLAAIVGSGIMGERLAGGNTAVALLANTLATGAALVALILTFAPVSGAHFNPLVTLAEAWEGGLQRRDILPYLAAQLGGAVAGVGAADAMFGEPVFAWSLHVRHGSGQFLGELIASFGLVVVIAGCSRRKPAVVPFAVASYIMSAYWFTASTCFANPAVTAARSLTNTFAGIRPADVPAFVVAQLLGATAATLLMLWLVPVWPAAAPRAVPPGAPSSADRKGAS